MKPSEHRLTRFQVLSTGFILEKMPCPPPCDNTVIYNNGSTSYVGGAEYLLVIDRHSVNYTKVTFNLYHPNQAFNTFG